MARGKTKDNTTGANLGFESKLWSMAGSVSREVNRGFMGKQLFKKRMSSPDTPSLARVTIEVSLLLAEVSRAL
jgi:hypothetical protein